MFRRFAACLPARLSLKISRKSTGVRPMKNVMLVGGGKIGVAIAQFLSGTGD